MCGYVRVFRTYCEWKGNESRSSVEMFVWGTRKYLINATPEALVRPDLLFKVLSCLHCFTLPGLPSVRLELLIRLRGEARGKKNRGTDQDFSIACSCCVWVCMSASK